MFRKRAERKCEEMVGGNDHFYIFAGTLGRSQAFAEDVDGMDIAKFSIALVRGEMPINAIRAYLAHTLKTVDGSEKFDVEIEVERFLEDFGLEDSAMLCTLLLHHAIVGKVKKKRENRSLKTKRLIFSILTYSKKFGFKLAAVLTIGAILLCMNFNCVMNLFVKLMA